MKLRAMSRVLIVGAIGVSALLAGTPGADARPPKPKPLGAPAPAVVTSFSAPEATAARYTISNPSEFGVDVSTTISGSPPTDPFAGISPYVVFSLDTGLIFNLQPSTTYTVSVVRFRFYDAGLNKAVDVRSAPTTFTFTTPSLAASRPSAPVISIAGSPPGTVNIAWAPSTDNSSTPDQIQYFYTVAQDPFRQSVPTCSSYCFGTTGTLIPRPAPGTSISVTVTARDGALIDSLPSNTLVITG
jgi:hypothetical protein